MFFFMLLHDKIPLYLLLPGTALLGMHLITLHNEMGSKPGQFGHVLLLMGLLIPYLRTFSKRSMLLGCILVTAATFTKEYNIIGYLLLLGYYFVYYDRRHTIKLGCFSALFYGASLMLYEYYLPNSYGALIATTGQAARPSRIISHVIQQKFDILFDFFWPLFVLFALCILIRLSISFVRMKHYQKSYFNFNELRMIWKDFKQTKRPPAVSYANYLCVATLLIYFLLIVPKTNYNHYYYYNIYLFFLLWAAWSAGWKCCQLLSESNNAQPFHKYVPFLARLSFMIFISCIVLSYYAVWPRFNHRRIAVMADYTEEWDEFRELIRPYKNVLAFRLLTPILCEQDKEYTESGQSEYFLFTMTKANLPFFQRLGVNYIHTLRAKVKNHQYDALFLRASGDVNNAFGIRFSDIELQEMGYEKFYEKTLRSTFYKYRIKGWR